MAGDSHEFLEMISKHQTAVREERRAAMAALTAAETVSAGARIVVTGARMAAEAVEQLIEERDAAILAEAERREQHVLDDIVRAGRTARRRGAARSGNSPQGAAPGDV